MNGDLGNVIRSITEASQALEREPGHLNRIKELEQQHIDDGARVARLEAKIIDMSALHDNLLAKLRSVEAERDDYGFRHMAAEDKANAVVRVLKDLQNVVGTAIHSAEPPQPNPVAPPDQSAADPTSAPASGTGSGTGSEVSGTESEDKPVWWRDREASGRFLPETSVEEPKPQGPYSGKKYWQVPGYVSREDWLSGGGRIEDYTMTATGNA